MADVYSRDDVGPGEESVEDVLDTIGNPKARTVLAAISREPRSALELVDDLDISRATMYRRLDELSAADLVTEATRVAGDGNHETVFECNFESTLVSLDDDEYDVRIFRQKEAADRFAELWADLGHTEHQ